MAQGQNTGSIYWDLDLDSSKFKRGLQESSREASSFNNFLESSRNASFAFAGALTAVGAAGFAAAGFGIKFAADIETMTAGFTTLLGSTDKAREAINMIKKDAASTPFELPGLIKANQMLTAVTKDAKRSERLLLNIGKGLTAMGRSGAELDNVIFNLQQIANTGKITEIDIRQFGNAGINVLELLADHYGVTKDKAVEMVKNSDDAFGDLEQAFQKAGEGSGKFAKAFELQGGTWNQLWSNFKDSLGIAMAELVTSLGIFDNAKKGLSELIKAINANLPTAVTLLKEFFNWIIKNGPLVAGIIIGGLTPAFIALALAFGSFAIHLAPFLIIGGLIGLLVQQLIAHFGGLQGTITALSPILSMLNDMFNVLAAVWQALILPALQMIWDQLKTQLIPELQRLWVIVGPTLIPIFKFLAVVIGGILLAAFLAFIAVLSGTISFVSTLINIFATLYDVVKKVFEFIGKHIKPITDSIGKLFGGNIKIPGFASGVTNFGGGLAMVGERGPELVNLPRGSSVTPNNKLGGNTFNINLSGVMASSRADYRRIGEELIGAVDEALRAKGKATILG